MKKLISNSLINYKKFACKNLVLKTASEALFNILPLETKEKIFRKSIVPYNEIEDKYKIIFIHIPKTAGKSFYYSLFMKDMPAHQTLSNYYHSDKIKFLNYTKITIVRNPWDRFASAYFYLKNKNKFFLKTERDKKFGSKYLENFNSLNDLILEMEKNKKLKTKILKWTHFKPQHEFIEIENKIEIDLLYRFEELESCFEHIKNVLNIDKEKKLQKRNINKNDSKNYSTCYNNETARIIENLYSKDIDLLNYNFPY